MPLGLVAVAFDADDPIRLASFWAGLLNRPIVDELDGALLPGDESQVGPAVRRDGHPEVRTEPAPPPPHERHPRGPTADGRDRVGPRWPPPRRRAAPRRGSRGLERSRWKRALRHRAGQ